ncbi:MAG TPA: hypothetical protein VNP73_01895 [Actinomycetota bacterium]|nr:hypothetical protein [Actinomycetota bacterium]
MDEPIAESGIPSEESAQDDSDLPTADGDEPAEESVFTSTADSEEEDASADGSDAEEDDGVVEDLGEGIENEESADADGATQGQEAPGGGGLGQRAESAVEGVIIGTVVGGQIAGGYGAAVGAAVFGLYGLITGDVPFDSGQNKSRPGAGGDADEALETEIEEELEKQGALEDEIEAELKRQEALLEQIDRQEEINQEIQKERDRRVALEQADPLSAPPVPYLRDIPDSIFDSEERLVEGTNKVVKSLDADRDGRPEMEKVYDNASGNLDRVSQDTNYDGLMDTQFEYNPAGEIVATVEDTDQDGVPDRWITFEGGSGTRVEVDRNNDGVRDGFLSYSEGVLASEEYDDDGDGVINRSVDYANKSRSVEREDRDGDGKVDFWTYYEPGGRPVRVEKDTKQAGKPDVWEYYEGTDPGNMVIVRKEEDLNGDSAVDVTSYYENGRLNRKEIQNPEALKK